MMRGTKRTLVVMALTLVSCSTRALPAATPTVQPSALRIFATTPMLPLLQDLTLAYSRLNPHITFEIGSGSYEAVAERMRRGDVPYFLSNHLPYDDAVWAAPVGQDGIAIIVPTNSVIQRLTTAQLRSIYGGEFETMGMILPNTDTPEVRLRVISREAGSGTRAEFEILVMGNQETTRTALIAPSSEAMLTAVARTPEGIGYVSASFLALSARRDVRAISINDALPTSEAIYNNTYPLRTILYVEGLREPQNDMRAFIAWVQSPAGQAVVNARYVALP